MLPTRSSFTLQIALNLLPLIGVAFLNWSAFALLYAYWLETLAIAFFNTIKIISSQRAGILYRLYRSIKFILTQSGMLIFYLIFIVAFIGMQVKHADDNLTFVNYFALIDPSFRIAIILMFITKGIELIVTFFVSGEFRTANPDDYYYFFSSRIILIHIVIVLGFFSFDFFNKQFGAYYGVLLFTTVFVSAKMILDYFSFNVSSNEEEKSHIPYL